MLPGVDQADCRVGFTNFRTDADADRKGARKTHSLNHSENEVHYDDDDQEDVSLHVEASRPSSFASSMASKQLTVPCSSCRTPLSAPEAQSAKEGAGRCSSCQERFKAGYVCSECNEVWLPSTSDVLCCDTCGAYVHSKCDEEAAASLQDPFAELYCCPPCRSRSTDDLLLQYCVHLRCIRPTRPHTPFHLFSLDMIKKYHADGYTLDFREAAPLIGDAWRELPALDKRTYERAAAHEALQYQTARFEYDNIFNEYLQLISSLKRAPEFDLILDADRATTLLLPPSPAAPVTGNKRPRSETDAPEPQDATRGGDNVSFHAPEGVKLAKKQAREEKVVKEERAVVERSGEDDPVQVAVVCNGMRGMFLLALQRVICKCKDCVKKPLGEREFSPTQFEQHCGAGSAKKWKASIRVEPGAVPEVPPGSMPMQFGKWMEMRGLDMKPRMAGQAQVPGTAAAAVLKKADKLPVKAVPKVEWQPWKDASLGHFKPISVRWAGDRCSVCDSDVDWDNDQMVSCDSCGITVHQSCYGIPELPGLDDMWLCRACELREEGQPSPQCCLCPVSGGALKPTTEPGGWCHAACMQWIPEVTCIDPTRMEPIDRIQYIQKERWELLCCVCKQRMGAKIQCNDCFSAFHPLCARMAGLAMEMDAPADDAPLRLVSYCPRHCQPRPWVSGIQPIKSGLEAVNDGSENGLWNGQTYPPPKCLAIPQPSAGCARAMAFLVSSRKPHGAGVGWTSNAGFWIPDHSNSTVITPHKHAPPSTPAKALSRLSKRSVAGRAKKTIPLGSIKKSSNRPAASSGLGNDEPPPPTELMPLPDGVPETVNVACNGRHGVLTIRNQKVLYAGSEVSASRFEQLAGKGEAKKWKCSVWACRPDDTPEMQMQEWLNKHRMDRKMLQVLQLNATAHEAYQEWLNKGAGEGDGGTMQDGEEEDMDADEDGVNPKVEPDEKVEPGSPSKSHGGEMEEGEEGGQQLSDTGLDEKSEAMTNHSAGPDGGENEMESKEEQVQVKEEDRDNDGIAGDVPTSSGRAANAEAEVAAEADKKGTPTAAPKSTRLRLVRPEDVEALALEGIADTDAVAALPPEDQVGMCCRVWWPADEEWYAADVVEYDPSTGCHRLWYFDDEEFEWLDLEREAQQHRLQWLPQTDSSSWPPSPPPPPSKRPALKLLIKGPISEATSEPREGAGGENTTTHPSVPSVKREREDPSNCEEDLDSQAPEAGAATAPDDIIIQQKGSNNPHAAKKLKRALGQSTAGEAQNAWDFRFPAGQGGVTSNHKTGDREPMHTSPNGCGMRGERGVHVAHLGENNGGDHFSHDSRPERAHSMSRYEVSPMQPRSTNHNSNTNNNNSANANTNGNGNNNISNSGIININSNVFDEDPASRGGLEPGATPRASEEGRALPSRLLFANRGSGGSSGVLIDMKIEADDGLSIPGRSGGMAGLVHAGVSGGLSDMSLPRWNSGSPSTSDLLRRNGALGEGWSNGGIFGGLSRSSLGISNLSNISNLDGSAGANGDVPGTSLEGSPTNPPHSEFTSAGHHTPSSPASRSPSPPTSRRPPTVPSYRSHPKSTPPSSPPPSSPDCTPPDSAPPTQDPSPSDPPDPPKQNPTGPDAVGWRIGVWWSDDSCYYYGNLLSYHAETNTHLIHYDDDEKEWLQLDREPVLWLRGPEPPPGMVAGERCTDGVEDMEDEGDMGSDADEHSDEQVTAFQRMPGHYTTTGTAAEAANENNTSRSVPDSVRILCNNLKGTFLVKGFAVKLDTGKMVSPTEFERLAGKGSSKKWKASLRVMKSDGSPGITMQEWLLASGVESARAQAKTTGDTVGESKGAKESQPAALPRPAISLDEVRRRHSQAVKRTHEMQAQQRKERESGEKPRGESKGGGDKNMAGRQGHRSNCMCVICKQARRKAEPGARPSELRSRSAPRSRPIPTASPFHTPRTQATTSLNTPSRSSNLPPRDPTHTYTPAHTPASSPRARTTPPNPFDYPAQPTQRQLSKLGREARQATRAADTDTEHPTASTAYDNAYKVYTHKPLNHMPKTAVPLIRTGKGAFLSALPHLVRGPQRQPYWCAPPSRCWTPEAWTALQAGQDATTVAALNATGAPTSLSHSLPARTPSASNLADLDGGDADEALMALHTGNKAAVKVSKISLWRERIRLCYWVERERLTFGKSGIHGWGLFAKQPIPQDTMIIEYRGVTVRPIIADLCEKKYHKEGTDCYLFHVNDDVVIDATNCGTIGRFTNHCCSPSMYTKVLDLDGDFHLCFFARADIKAGQELTFDYRFKEEEGDRKLQCRCGAPNCRGFLN